MHTVGQAPSVVISAANGGKQLLLIYFLFLAHIFARKENQFRIRKKVFREEKLALNFLNKFKVQKLIK